MYIDALRVMNKIREKPSQASKFKTDHFANVGVLEVFLESVPTTFLLILISIVGLTYRDGTDGLGMVLIGSRGIKDFGDDPVSSTLFVISCATSIFSAAFGMSR